MKTSKLLHAILVFLTISAFVVTYAFAQPAKDGGNIYTKWVTLALLGKNQSEIEYYFRNEKEASIEKVKDRLRFAVLENLRRSGLKSMISKASDADDLNVAVTKILLEIRFAGMEHDRDLLLSIKEEFGLELQNL